MKRLLIYTTILSCAFVLVGLSTRTFAQETIRFEPTPGMEVVGNPAGVFGQDHSYTVTFRGNGEAVVNMKAVFTNYEEATTSAITFEVPQVQPENIGAYQIVREKSCMQWEQQKYNPITETYKPENPRCVVYQEPNYYDYYSSNSKFYRAKVNLDGDKLTVQLPVEVGPQLSGSIIVYYRASGYTKQGLFGKYDYTFETLKSSDSIRSLTVGITTDSDLKLKGAESEVNYDMKSVAAPMVGSARMGDRGFESMQFDTYYQRIGMGRIVKTASELQPMDSFTVAGSYGKSMWSLYAGYIMTGIGIVLVLIAVIGWAIRYLIRHAIKQPIVKGSPAVVTHTVSSPLIMLGGSFFSSLMAAGFTVVLFLLFRFINTIYYSDFNTLILLFLILISFVIYPVLMFGPALYMGIRRGVWWGVGTFSLTIFWLSIYLVLVFMYLLFIKTGYSNPMPVPYVESTPIYK